MFGNSTTPSREWKNNFALKVRNRDCYYILIAIVRKFSVLSISAIINLSDYFSESRNTSADGVEKFC